MLLLPGDTNPQSLTSILLKLIEIDSVQTENHAVKALLIKQPWIDLVLARRKTWEIRGSATSVRGQIALIQSGSGMVVGVCDLLDVIGPLTTKALRDNVARHRVPRSGWRHYDRPHAWTLCDARRLREPVPYKHPPGAMIWVNLSPSTSHNVECMALHRKGLR